MENIKSNLKGVVGSVISGIPLDQLEEEYYNLTQSMMDYKALGFNNLRTFLDFISDVVKVVNRNGQLIVKMAVSRDDPQTLVSLYDLVLNTKTKKKVNRNISNQQNNCAASVPLEHFSISVTNNLCKTAGKEFKPTKEITHTSSRPALRNVVTNTSRDIKLTKGSSEIKNGSKENGVKGSNDEEENLDYGCWFVKPVISFESFHKHVRVIGIQCGHVVVVGAHTKSRPMLLDSKNVTTVYPGDLVLWQPPFDDAARPKTAVDLHTAFPSIIIRRVDMKRVQVRIMGLAILLDVAIADLYDLPTTGKVLARAIATIRGREATVLRLALVPPTVTIWDRAVCGDASYTVIFSLDEGGQVLESCADTGHFLNLEVLSHINEQTIHSDNDNDKRAFLQHMVSCIDRSLAALVPVFEKLVAGQDNIHPTSDPLRLIYNIRECSDEIMVGSKLLLSSSPSLTDREMTSRSSLRLLRMKCWDHKSVAYNFDNESDEVNIVQQQGTLVGLYVINSTFTKSLPRINDSLRLRTALLTIVPSIVTLRLGFGIPND